MEQQLPTDIARCHGFQCQRDKIEAHIGRTTMSVYGTQSECKAARDALQRLIEDDE